MVFQSTFIHPLLCADTNLLAYIEGQERERGAKWSEKRNEELLAFISFREHESEREGESAMKKAKGCHGRQRG